MHQPRFSRQINLIYMAAGRGSRVHEHEKLSTGPERGLFWIVYMPLIVRGILVNQ